MNRRPDLIIDQTGRVPHQRRGGLSEGLARCDRRLRHVPERVVAERRHGAVYKIPLVDKRIVVVVESLQRTRSQDAASGIALTNKIDGYNRVARRGTFEPM